MKHRIIINRFLVKSILPGVFFCIFSGYLKAQPNTGDVFPGWAEGYLDIHHINTGKGECAFFILPDGTTFLVDAGATQRTYPSVTHPKPNASRTPGEWISRYIKHILKGLSEEKLNYVLLTHFHYDHIGQLSPEAKTSKTGAYKLTGITEVAEFIPFDKVVDRGWPNYNWPEPSSYDFAHNYIKFVKFNQQNRNFEVEQFKVGTNKQFFLLNKPDKYPNFEIRNIACNGHIWTGVGTNERNHFPLLENLEVKEYPSENMCCAAFRLSYGKFDYFNGGDITAGVPGTWQDVETPVGLVTGPVDVCIANHHACNDAMSTNFLRAVRPRIHLIQAWAPSHPSPLAFSRILSNESYPGPRDVFTTNIMDETITVVGDEIDQMKCRQGHIVIRVNPGGETYKIYILDDSEENFEIIAIHGPYNSN